jgi:ATPase subunit of ABC transporter with duplicated ATPase domains
MAVVNVSRATFAHPGGAELFDDVTFRVASGKHVGLVGPNGVGKTTLLRCVTGELSLRSGAATTDASVAYMPQAIGVDEDAAVSVRELLTSFSSPAVRAAGEALARAEHANEVAPTERTGVALANAVIRWGEVDGYQHETRWDSCCASVLRQPLSRAGTRPISQLSGGERKRLVLEMLLASDHQILLLDEPDNFLDIPAKRWLEDQIATSAKTILFITHDRALLDASATGIVTLEARGCWVHAGPWRTYDQARRDRNAALGDAVRRWKEEERRLFFAFKQMKQWASLNDGNARKADVAEHRWQRWVDVGPPPPPPPERGVRMRLRGADGGKVALTVEGLEISGLTEPFDLDVRMADRIAVLGGNGTGKSHFLRLLAGDDVEHDGAWRYGARTTPGLFHQTDDIDAFRDRTALEVVQALDLDHQSAMKALARYGLVDGADRPVETLSGGQRARLQILHLELRQVNFLLLDEPTDNLDLASAEALEAALDTFTGTVVCVTHDRWFMRAFDRFVLFDDDCTVREALALDVALRRISREDALPKDRVSLLDLSATG